MGVQEPESFSSKITMTINGIVQNKAFKPIRSRIKSQVINRELSGPYILSRLAHAARPERRYPRLPQPHRGVVDVQLVTTVSRAYGEGSTA